MPFAGGTGTRLDPYLISTPNQLNEIRNYLNVQKYFKLINDIDLNIAPYNSGNGWLPVGSSGNPFMGVIDLNGFSIKNLYISRGSTNQVGFFGIFSGLIRHGKFTSAYVVGNNTVGVVAGLSGGSIESIIADGYVEGHDYVGGFTGNNTGAFTMLKSIVNVAGYRYCGGFTGINRYHSTVNPQSQVSNSITHCFYSGILSAAAFGGGIIGRNYSSKVFHNLLVVGSINGKYAGGLCGIDEFTDYPNFELAYWDTQTTGTSTASGVTNQNIGGNGYTTYELKNTQIGSGIYSGWPTEIWWEINTSSYPQIYFLATYSAGTNGSISGTTSQKIPMGESGNEVTANGDTGYMFDKWSDGSTENPRKETNVFWEIDVIASFTVKTSTVSFTAGNNGKLSVGGVEMSTYSVQVTYGGNVDPVTIIPNENFSFLRWSDGNTDTTRTETNVTDDIIVYAIIVTDTEYEKFTDIILNSDNTITNNISIHFFPQVLKQYKNTTIYKFLRKAIMYDTALQNIYTENNDFLNTLPLHFNAVINNGESSDIRVYDKYDTTGTDATRDNTVFSLSKIDFTNFIYSNVIKDTSVTGFKHTDKTFNKQQVILTKALAYDGIEKKLKYIKLSGIFSNIKIYIFTDFPDDLLYNKLYKIDNEKYNDFISNKKITEIEFKRNDFEDIGTSVYGDRICDVLLDVNRDIRFKPITGRSFTLLCVCNFEPTEEIDGYVTKDGCAIRRISLIYDELPTRSKKY